MVRRGPALLGVLLAAACGSRTSLERAAALDPGPDPVDAGADGPAPLPALPGDGEPLERIYYDSEPTDLRLIQITVAAAPDDGVFVAGGNAAPVNVAGRRLGAGAFLTSLDREGRLRWVAPIESQDGGSRIAAAVGLADGSVVVGGYLSDEVDFGGIRATPRDPDGDGFVARYDAGGGLLWLTVFGSLGPDRVDTLEPGAGDRVYAGGYVGGAIDFGTGPAGASGHDPFLLELDGQGRPLRARVIGCEGEYSGLLAIARLATGDVLVTGYATGRLSLDTLEFGSESNQYRAFWARFAPDLVLEHGAGLELQLARAAERGAADAAFIAGQLQGPGVIAGALVDAAARGGPLIVKLEQDSETGATLLAHAGSVFDLAFDPRGRLYATGALVTASEREAPYLALYEAGAIERLITWDDHRVTFSSLALTPGGHLWIGGSYESRVRLGAELHEAPAPSGFVVHLRPE